MGRVYTNIGVGAALETWTAYKLLTSTVQAPETKGPWRPPQWNQKQLTYITADVPNADGSTATTQTSYFLDAVIKADHKQSLRRTEHPVQSGGNLVDHAYMLPAELMLEIGMSDAMDRYDSNSYTSDTSKSVSAFQTLLYLQKLRTPLQVTTRLLSYDKMLIEDIAVPDDNSTRYGLKATIRLVQIFQATVTHTALSSRPQQSETTDIPLVPAHSPSAALLQNNKLPLDLVPAHVPGAGSWSSAAKAF